jgi:hypothetical protein
MSAPGNAIGSSRIQLDGQQRWRAAAEIPLGAVALLAVNVSLGNGLI